MVSKTQFKEFMSQRDNAELMRVIDLWFQSKTASNDGTAILCLRQGIDILTGLAAKEILELKLLSGDDEKFFNA